MSKKLKRQVQEQSKRFNAPQLIPSGSSQRRKPKFSFEYIQKKYCVSRCTKDEKVALVNRIHELSQLTWQEIMQADKHKQGCEIIGHMSIKAPLPSCITKDVKILAFRFKDKAPMVGFRLDEAFFIVWLDRDFTLYSH